MRSSPSRIVTVRARTLATPKSASHSGPDTVVSETRSKKSTRQ
jgi:hypothetical protein